MSDSVEQRYETDKHIYINPDQKYVLLRIHVFSSNWVYAKEVKETYVMR